MCKKINDFGIDLHAEVAQRVNGYLNSFGLKYTIWWTKVKHEHKNEYPYCIEVAELFQLNIPNFKKDKRTSDYSKKGRIVDIDFSCKYEYSEDYTFGQLFDDILKKDKEQKISDATEHVEALQKQLKESKNYLNELLK
jgi:hypothetical protein